MERQIVAKEKAALRRPITRDEFEYAQRLFFSDGKVTAPPPPPIDARPPHAHRTPLARGSEVPSRCLRARVWQIDLSEFMALELLRLDKIDAATLASIKREFERLDRDGSGELDAGEIETAA